MRLRRAIIAATERDGSALGAAATHPFSHWEDQTLTPRARYIGISQDYQQLAREQLVNGCHVHIGISDPEMAIQVMNRTRPHLAALLALSANSPYWLGTDTGYASYRAQIFGRWTFAGTPHVFNSRKEYTELVDALVKTESVEDATKIYWDVRPSGRFETLEFRVADVCLTINEAVMIAGICQALARTTFAEAQRDTDIEHARPELLRAAKWRAARYGLDADLIVVAEQRAAPAREVVGRLLDYLRPVLEESGEWIEVSALVDETFTRGNGATRQRAAYAANESYADVVDFIIAETKQGID
jgi:carboxylate-amine ligase